MARTQLAEGLLARAARGLLLAVLRPTDHTMTTDTHSELRRCPVCDEPLEDRECPECGARRVYP